MNCGNVITERSSTRLHAPPGGASSFSLSWGQPDEKKENVKNQPAPAPQPIASKPITQPQDMQTFGMNTRKGSNAYANGANQNCGNVLTDRPSTRVHAPPGGASSFVLG